MLFKKKKYNQTKRSKDYYIIEKNASGQLKTESYYFFIITIS